MSPSLCFYLARRILFDFFVVVFTKFFLLIFSGSSKKVHIYTVTEYSRQWQPILYYYFQIKFKAYRLTLDAFNKFNQTWVTGQMTRWCLMWHYRLLPYYGTPEWNYRCKNGHRANFSKIALNLAAGRWWIATQHVNTRTHIHTHTHTPHRTTPHHTITWAYIYVSERNIAGTCASKGETNGKM